MYWGAMLEALGVHCGDDFIFSIPDDRWKSCTGRWDGTLKVLLAMADGFGFNGKKQLEQTKWKVTVALGSKKR